MRDELLKEFSGKDLVLGGDGQCDSPGFNAKNLCYFMVEVNSNYILGIEVLDKRHDGLTSTNMEKEAVKRSLDRLQRKVSVTMKKMNMMKVYHGLIVEIRTTKSCRKLF